MTSLFLSVTIILMIITLLVFVGLSLGSFVNALVWRIHQQHLPKSKRAASDTELSIAKGRSMCPNCKHTLGAVDLIPVFSWLLLRGRCRYCHKAISPQYPVVELCTAALFVASYIFWPQTVDSFVDYGAFGVWLITLVGFVALVIYDLRWMLLPNRIVFPLTGLAAVYAILQAVRADEPTTSILSSLGGLLIAGGIFYVLFQLSGGRWIGGGDVKLGFALGLFLGSPIMAFLMLFVASLMGLVISLPAVLLGKKRLASRMPFGPFLILSTIVVQLFGQGLIDWYIHTVLYI